MARYLKVWQTIGAMHEKPAPGFITDAGRHVRDPRRSAGRRCRRNPHRQEYLPIRRYPGARRQRLDHYADRWEVLTTEGVLLGTRVLHHPHVHEQPFTRSLGGVEVPAGTTRILILARDSVHGYGDPPFALELPR